MLHLDNKLKLLLGKDYEFNCGLMPPALNVLYNPLKDPSYADTKRPFHPIVYCIMYAIKKSLTCDERTFSIFYKYPIEYKLFNFRENINLVCIQQELDLEINIYEEHKTFMYKHFVLAHSIKSEVVKHRINLVTQNLQWAWFHQPSKLDSFLKRFCCTKCHKWCAPKYGEDFAGLHYNTCISCPLCGRFKQHGKCPCKKNGKDRMYIDNYPLPHGEIRRAICIPPYQIDYTRNVSFADLETLVLYGNNGKQEAYAGGLKVSGDNKVTMWVQEGAIKPFVDALYELEGYLYFFNCSKFDLFLILEYLVQTKRRVLWGQSIFTNKRILRLTIENNYGKKLVIKDFMRFCVGSLKANGEALKLEVTKGELAHHEITSYDIVKEREGMIRAYLERDVELLSQLYMKKAESYAQKGLVLNDYETLPQIVFADWTLSLGPGLLYRLPIKKGNDLIESNIREAYFGGKCINVEPCYQSSKWPMIHNIGRTIAFLESKQRTSNVDDWIANEYKKLNDIYCSFDLDNPHNMENDSLCHIDACSLYPHSMYANKFPCGKLKDIVYAGSLDEWNETISDEWIRDLSLEAEVINSGNFRMEKDERILPNDERPRDDKLVWYDQEDMIIMKWKYRIVRVEMICPKDLLVAFVMTRKDKKLCHTLCDEDKTKSWYVGAVIIEALRLGYTIKKIYAYYEWEKAEYLFRDFVSDNFHLKSYAKDINIRDTAKRNLVALYGKHAQLNIQEQVHMMGGMNVHDIDTLKVKSEDMDYIVCDKTGVKLVACYKTKKEHQYTAYSCQLSIFTVAFAQIHMSRILSCFDGYKSRAVIEGDTDSLVLHYSSINQLKRENLELSNLVFGKCLGQMKDEMERHVLLCQTNIAPKNKKQVFLTPPILPNIHTDGKRYDMGEDETNPTPLVRIRTMIKSKGITHFRQPFNEFYDWRVNDEKRAKAFRIRKHLNGSLCYNQHYQPSPTLPNDSVMLGVDECLYICTFKTDSKYIPTLEQVPQCDRDTERVVSRLTDYEYFGVLMGWFDVMVLFGSMFRNLVDARSMQDFGVFLDYSKRSLTTVDWWGTDPETNIGLNREFTKDDPFPFGVSRPLGSRIHE
jgi:hypothetical protein